MFSHLLSFFRSRNVLLRKGNYLFKYHSVSIHLHIWFYIVYLANILPEFLPFFFPSHAFIESLNVFCVNHIWYTNHRIHLHRLANHVHLTYHQASTTLIIFLSSAVSIGFPSFLNWHQFARVRWMPLYNHQQMRGYLIMLFGQI